VSRQFSMIKYIQYTWNHLSKFNYPPNRYYSSMFIDIKGLWMNFTSVLWFIIFVYAIVFNYMIYFVLHEKRLADFKKRMTNLTSYFYLCTCIWDKSDLFFWTIFLKKLFNNFNKNHINISIIWLFYKNIYNIK